MTPKAKAALLKRWPWLALAAALVGGGGSYTAGVNPLTLLTGPQRIIDKLDALDKRIDDIQPCRDRRR